MEALLINVLNLSIAVSWLILLIIVLRKLLKKMPRRLYCVLWAMVAIRLLCPFSFESILSLIPSVETIPPQSAYIGDVPKIESGIDGVDREVNEFIESHEWIVDFGTEGEGFRRSNALLRIGVVWVSGMSAMLLYGWISYGRLKKKVEISLPKDGYYLCDSIDSPFILGVIRPRIYLPSILSDGEIAGVMAHEQAHLKRRDHWWKPMGYILLAVYWFHPLMWIGYLLFCRDVEMACDERVVSAMSPEERKVYSETLLSCSISRKAILACPLAFGEVGVKERIKAVTNYRKTGVWVIAAAIVICVTVALCFLTDPVSEETVQIIIGDGYTDCDDVDVQIKYLLWESRDPYFTEENDGPYVIMEWERQTQGIIHFGEYFELYRKGWHGNWVRCRTQYPVGYHDILYSVEGDGAERKFWLGAYDFSEEGEYLIRFEFYLGEDKSDTYTGNLAFEVEKTETTGYTELDRVDVSVNELILGGKWPYVSMEWENLSGKTIEYGLLYRLYYRTPEGALEECDIRESYGYDFISHKVIGKNRTRFFDLWYWDMSRAGEYVIAFEFDLKGEKPREEYTGYLEFTVP